MAKDETGSRFGMLQVLHLATFRGSTRKVRRWVCKCDCGKTVVKNGTQLRSKAIVSCGCKKSKICYDRNYRHGKAHTRTWQRWASMKSRCTNPRASSFNHYGGRGIKVCDRWKDFKNFLEDMGECPDGKSLDRINVNGNYEPLNCRWATKTEQMNNRTIRRIEQFSDQEIFDELQRRKIQITIGFSKNAPSTVAGPVSGEALAATNSGGY